MEDLERRVDLLHVGRVDIVHCINQLPATHHQPDGYVIDAIVPPMGKNQMMFLMVHGHFWEGNAIYIYIYIMYTYCWHSFFVLNLMGGCGFFTCDSGFRSEQVI